VIRRCPCFHPEAIVQHEKSRDRFMLLVYILALAGTLLLAYIVNHQI